MEVKTVYVTYDYDDGYGEKRWYDELIQVYCEAITESAIIREIRNRHNAYRDIVILGWHE